MENLKSLRYGCKIQTFQNALANRLSKPFLFLVFSLLFFGDSPSILVVRLLKRIHNDPVVRFLVCYNSISSIEELCQTCYLLSNIPCNIGAPILE